MAIATNTRLKEGTVVIQFETGVYVVIQQLEGSRAPRPMPLENGFSNDVAYRVLGLHSPSETSECYLVLANDRDELWFISNRHCRFHRILPAGSPPIPRFAAATTALRQAT
ncbi:MAG: hypothetical protein H0T80_09015 [Betaproteobacteria bacterium]|nr:hypothetical protein [Betaproteobacteria bacterium]